jgi:hypothetical protein
VEPLSSHRTISYALVVNPCNAVLGLKGYIGAGEVFFMAVWV